MTMDLNALQLACRFALPPNSLGYCGRNSAPEKFKKCVIDGYCGEIEEELRRFIVLNPYLETLSKITKKPKFSRAVIEAYWLGSEELKKAKASDYHLLLDNFAKQGVPLNFVEELRLNLPKVFIPSHLFQILHVGVGKASGAVPFNLESINNCMIRWGKVKSIGTNTIKVNLYSLKKLANFYKLAQKDASANYIPRFLPNLQVGEIVAVHWNQAVKLLTPKEVEKLSFWTNEVLSSLKG